MGKLVPPPPPPPEDRPASFGSHFYGPGPLYPRNQELEPEVESRLDRVLRNPEVIQGCSILGTLCLLALTVLGAFLWMSDPGFQSWVADMSVWCLALILLSLFGAGIYSYLKGLLTSLSTPDVRKSKDEIPED